MIQENEAVPFLIVCLTGSLSALPSSLRCCLLCYHEPSTEER